MTNSRRKGKTGELEVAHILQERGIDAHRGQQYCGANGDADVIGLDGYHLEVKRCNTARIREWCEQAENDARDGEVPVVVFRADGQPWRVLMGFSDFLDMVQG